ncbi:helix-turn-helix domain-containing protein [Polaribacter glomeratus]|uniref:DNA-binding protein n=1 Tax=Polaribacter glomeratus TaxID=102 RepID=A0A2S7WH73_9FLAO|nr:helix-turn-helix domain-containing protein [Polaribacter glomeratus]PQJ76968.1 DNA-binding protein [Polaribacter glomeratus]TXD67183.1 helix-turn-helix domain-containing protein [Polaribacter glomeratus]
MQQVQFISISPEQLQNAIINGVKNQLQELKKFYQPKEPTQFITRNYVADEMLHCDLSTVHNLTKKGILTKYQIGGRVLYKRSEVENAIIKLKK